MANLNQFRNQAILIGLIASLPFALCLYYLIYINWLYSDKSRHQLPDEWSNSPDQEMLSKAWSTLSQDRIYEVPGDMLEETIPLLGDTSVVELTEQQYAKYAGANRKSVDGNKPYLIRAIMVSGTRLTGNFEVRQRRTVLWAFLWLLDQRAFSRR